MHHQEGVGSGSPVAAQFLHHLTSRRHRALGLVGVALVLMSVAVWMYGGFATGIDFVTSRPSPPEHLSPAPSATVATVATVATGANGAHNANGASGATVPDATGNQGTPGADLNGANDAPAVDLGNQTKTDNHAEPTQAAQDALNDSSNDHNDSHSGSDNSDEKDHDDLRHSHQSPAADISPGIPSKIWQILLPKKKTNEPFVANPKNLEDTPSWLAMNPDYTYTLVGEKGGNDFVHKHFGSDPRIVEAYNRMPNVGMKSDLLRYLILSAEGGVYTDTDTVAIKPIDQWVPEHMRDKVAVVVGIEFDRRDGGPWADILHWVQFCQWTIAAAPGHPVFRKMVLRILESLNDLSAAHGVPVEELKPSSLEVMNSTGPAAWSEVVFKQLQEYEPSLKEHKDLSFMTEPRLIGNILVLTIDGFGMGQPHSKSTNDGTIPKAALVKHLFKGGWRGNKRRRLRV